VKQSLAGRLLRALVARRGSIVAPLSASWQRERELIADTRSKTQLLLTDAAALHLTVCARAASRLPGAFAEAGVFKGGSARLICEEKGDTPLHLFDVFESLQAPTNSDDEEVREHFGSTCGCERDVRQLLGAYASVHIHSGIFPGTTRGLGDQRYAFVHLDLDLPGATRAALDYFHPRLVSGGIMLADDYSDVDLKACIDGWFNGKSDTLIELPWSQLMVVRQGAAA
jgi:O-methyltransferase